MTHLDLLGISCLRCLLVPFIIQEQVTIPPWYLSDCDDLAFHVPTRLPSTGQIQSKIYYGSFHIISKPSFKSSRRGHSDKMMKVWSLKQQQQKDAQADGQGQKKKKKVTAAQLRVQKGKGASLSEQHSNTVRVAQSRKYVGIRSGILIYWCFPRSQRIISRYHHAHGFRQPR